MLPIITMLLLVSHVGCARNKSAYEQLAQDIFYSYNEDIWPAEHDHDTITVKIGLAAYRLVKLSEMEQSVTISVWLRWVWVDDRLTWNISDYENITDILTSRAIWKPDITLYGDIRSEERPLEKFQYSIRYDGEVMWKANIIYETYCKQNAFYFPFDQQNCHLKFGSWAYNGNQINVVNISTTGDVSQYVSNGEWDLLDMPVVVTQGYYPCCPEPYPDVTFTLVLQRRGTFYVINLILPVFFMVLLTTGSFYLPAESGEKASLAVTIFLSQMVYNVVVIQYLPTQSENTPLIEQYLITVQVLMALSTTLNVTVIHVYHRGQHGWQMPRWVKRIFFHELGTLLRFTNTVNLYKQRKIKIRQAQDILKKGDELVHATALSVMSKRTARVHPHDLDDGDRIDEPHDDRECADAEFIRLQRNILVQLKYMLRSSTARMRTAFFRSEWALLAMILDRMLFYAMSVLTVVFAFALSLRFMYRI
ncbi:Neuronal acetylcholine receptor subunit alpha-10 [Lamellibrachia satsuma]|nr:Neuronal acetylcholine receptor subunit alpha-10 [Lamellibrachia satsuma]